MAKKTTTAVHVAKKVPKKVKVNSIYDALYIFQGNDIVIPKNGVSKASDGTEYHYPYLDDVIKVTRPFMQSAGLAFSQIIVDNVLVTTLIALHADPAQNKLESKIPLGNPSSPQDMGARITYARRYTLLGVLGLVGDQDIDADPNKVKSQENGSAPTAPATPRDASKKTDAPDPSKSTPYQKAWNIIESAKNKEALEEIRKNISASVKPYAPGEKEELYEIINKKII